MLTDIELRASFVFLKYRRLKYAKFYLVLFVHEFENWPVRIKQD